MAGNTIGQLFRVTTFGESHGIASVSYTHLDVYKRQFPDKALCGAGFTQVQP